MIVVSFVRKSCDDVGVQDLFTTSNSALCSLSNPILAGAVSRFALLTPVLLLDPYRINILYIQLIYLVRHSYDDPTRSQFPLKRKVLASVVVVEEIRHTIWIQSRNENSDLTRIHLLLKTMFRTHFISNTMLQKEEIHTCIYCMDSSMHACVNKMVGLVTSPLRCSIITMHIKVPYV